MNYVHVSKVMIVGKMVFVLLSVLLTKIIEVLLIKTILTLTKVQIFWVCIEETLYFEPLLKFFTKFKVKDF